MTNEINILNSTTVNYQDFRKAMEKLSITHIIDIVDYINQLSEFIPQNYDILDYRDEIIKPFMDVINECKAEKKCPHCGSNVFKSDLPQYDYVCSECNENLYRGEVK